MTRAIYPGSFDPVTNGHYDIIKRAAAKFDLLYVVVLNNRKKDPMFTVEERVQMLKRLTEKYNNVVVDSFSGLLIDYATQNNIGIIVKGLRAISDFEYEFQMALMNKNINEHIETMFMMTNSEFQYLSSSMIKEAAYFHAKIDTLVPDFVEKALQEKLDIIRALDRLKEEESE